MLAGAEFRSPTSPACKEKKARYGHSQACTISTVGWVATSLAPGSENEVASREEVMHQRLRHLPSSSDLCTHGQIHLYTHIHLYHTYAIHTTTTNNNNNDNNNAITIIINK